MADHPLIYDPVVKFGKKTGLKVTAVIVFLSILILRIQFPSHAPNNDLITQIFGEFIFCYFIFAWFGLVLGEHGAKSKGVLKAFCRGGISLGGLAFVFYLIFALLALGRREFVPISIFFAPVIVYFISFGAIVSGVSAVAVRDFRQFQKARFLPQFTLQELFVTFSLITILVSILSSIRFFGDVLVNW